MIKAHYNTSEPPAPVTVHEGDGVVAIELSLNPAMVEVGDAGRQWEVDYTSFRFSAGASPVPAVEDVRRRPEAYSTLSGDLDAMKEAYVRAVQAWMNAEAQTHGYDDIFTAVGYVGDPNERFAAEGEACRAWRSEVWTACYAYLDAVLAGDEELVPVEALIDRLPQMHWPND